MASGQSIVPVIDFGQFSIDLPEDSVDQHNVDRIATEITESFSTLGFVYLKNCGISDGEVSLISSLFIP